MSNVKKIIKNLKLSKEKRQIIMSTIRKNRVVHCKKEPYDVYIGRPSKWGNPFSHKINTIAKFKVSSREEAIEKYKEWILNQPELLKDLHELKDKVLGCWCRPLSCHGDILIELLDDMC